MSGNDGKKPAAVDPNRARARALRDERVDRILSMMTGFAWMGRRSSEALAEEWGVGINTVNDYAREASGIRRKLEDQSEVRERIRETVEQVREVFAEARGSGELREALKAAEILLKSDGAFVTKVQEVAPEGDPLATREQLVAALKRLDEAIAADGAKKAAH